MSNSPKIGDIFTLPSGDGRVGIGQVVAEFEDDAYYFVVFNRVLKIPFNDSDAIEAMGSGIRFITLSFDGKIHAGHWRVLGNMKVPEGIPFPAYKEVVDTPENVMTVDYTGTRTRKASSYEAENLPYRRFSSPAILERAFRADLGLESENEAFERLRPNGITSKELFGGR